LVSLAFAYKRERTPRAFPDSLQEPAISFSSGSSRARGALIAKTLALVPLDSPNMAQHDSTHVAPTNFRAAQTYPRRILRVNEQKRSPNLKELPGTPR
jgi:hypothetical protein